MLQSKFLIALLSVLTVVAVSVGTAAFLSSQSANSKPKDDKELKGSGSSDDGKSAHQAVPPSTTAAAAKSTPVANGKEKETPKDKDGDSKKDFTISGTAPSLYPGATKQLALTVNNSNNFAVKVTALTVTTTAASTAGCTISSISADSFSGALIVEKNSTATTSVAIRMADSTPDACQGAEFTLVYSGIGEKA